MCAIVAILMLSRRPATSAPGKGTDNRNKGIDNRNKGTDNRNKVLVMQAAVGVVANPVGRRRSVHEVSRAGLSFPILLSAVMASQPLSLLSGSAGCAALRLMPGSSTPTPKAFLWNSHRTALRLASWSPEVVGRRTGQWRALPEISGGE